ncbi:MAG: cohesin domain-containing protein [Dehalococcoidia bacterium]
MKGKMVRLIAALVLMLVAIPIAGIGVAFAQTTPVYASPPSQTVSPGEVFTVDIYVEPGEPIVSVQAGLSFDPDLLTADSWVEGDLVNLNGDFTYLLGSTIDNVAGTIEGIGIGAMRPGVSGPGSFVTITFTAGETTGTSPLVLTWVMASAFGGVEADTTATDGDVTIEEAGGGRCFIATSTIGPDDSSVDTLRAFRDNYLTTNPAGRGFVSAYYTLSPPIAGFIDDHPSLKPAVRAALVPSVGISTAAESTGLAHKIAIAGSMALASTALAVWLRRRQDKASDYS